MHELGISQGRVVNIAVFLLPNRKILHFVFSIRKHHTTFIAKYCVWHGDTSSAVLFVVINVSTFWT